MLPFINQDILIFAILLYSMVFAFGYKLIKVIVEQNKEHCDNFSLSSARAIGLVMLVSVVLFFIFLTGV